MFKCDDILGFKLEDGINLIKDATDKSIKLIETFSPKEEKSLSDTSKEIRILRILEKDKSIEVTVGYF